MPTYAEILYETHPPLAWLTLNRPDRANALSIRMIREMTVALQEAGDDPKVKVLIIRGAGNHFSAGHYMKEMVGKDIPEHRRIFMGCTAMMRLIRHIAVPVIAQVHGVATAAGCQLAAACDLVVAEQGARFSTPGVSIGLFCGTPMVALTRAVGRKAAMEMLLTGRMVPAEEARAMGLVNRVTAPEELADQTQRLALDIARASRLVLAGGKRAFYAQVDGTDEKAYDYATCFMEYSLLAKDAQNGIQAFLDKTGVEWEDK